jgi:hypothetical protein
VSSSPNTCFRRASMRSLSSVVGISSKRFSFPLTAAIVSSRAPSLHGRYPFPRYYEPLRLPARAVPSVMYSLGSLGYGCPFPALPGLPGSSTDLFLRAVPNHPGRSDECLLIASPPITGFIILGRLATSASVTRPNRVRYPTARRFASPVSARQITPSRSGSATCSNEQFTW